MILLKGHPLKNLTGIDDVQVCPTSIGFIAISSAFQEIHGYLYGYLDEFITTISKYKRSTYLSLLITINISDHYK